MHIPAGADLGHTTHREMAVAIIADLASTRGGELPSGGAVVERTLKRLTLSAT